MMKLLLYLKRFYSSQEEEMAKLLMIVPGIDHYSAVLIVSEIGEISRFPDSYHISSWVGLVPSTHSSD